MSNVEAIVADADNGKVPASFDFGGRTFTLGGRMDLRCVVFLQRGDFERVWKMALGAEQAEALLTLDTDEPFDDAALQRMLEAWAEGSGATLGKFSASTGSSKSTGRRSKRTSPATTASS